MVRGVERRTYASLDDLEPMKAVLREGRRVSPRSGYAHPGEVDWWFYYPNRTWSVTIWEDDRGPAGWIVLDPEDRSAEMAVRPDLRGGPGEDRLIAHVDEVLGDGGRALYAWADDVARAELLARRGYEPAVATLQTFSCDLTDPIAVPPTPAGFTLLDAVTDEWVIERAECHHRAFDPSRMTAERYAAFRDAPDYDPALDVAVASDDGRIVAYAMAWFDSTSRSGQLEPVGTRPHFWRRGLGQVANREALRRLRERGAAIASVNTYPGHEGNIAFYQSCGFELGPTIDRWVRP
jgi:GNAT superfamily N-acetyltransferase